MNLAKIWLKRYEYHFSRSTNPLIAGSAADRDLIEFEKRFERVAKVKDETFPKPKWVKR